MGFRVDMFATEANPRECEAGEVIFRTYDMGAEMYVVLEGEVDASLAFMLAYPVAARAAVVASMSGTASFRRAFMEPPWEFACIPLGMPRPG